MFRGDKSYLGVALIIRSRIYACLKEQVHEDIQEAFAVFREMMDDFENWYPYDADDTEDDKQDAIDSFARAKLNLEGS